MQIYLVSLLIAIQSLWACRQPSEASLMLANVGGDPKATLEPLATNLIFQSADEGVTWQDVSAGLPKNLEIWSAGADDHEIYLGTETSIYRSSKGLVVGMPLWEKDYMFDDRALTIKRGKTGIYVYSNPSYFYHNLAGTNVWVRMNSPLQENLIYGVYESANGALFIGGDMGIFKSTDHGKHWKNVYSGGLVFDFNEKDSVMLVEANNGIARSTDGGEHWEPVLKNTGVNTASVLTDHGYFGIIGTYDKNTLHTSTDAGKTWHLLQGKGLPSDGSFNNLKSHGKYLYACHTEGIFRSEDGGKNWINLRRPVYKEIFTLIISGDMIFAVPGKSGC